VSYANEILKANNKINLEKIYPAVQCNAS
jgi:hypothetical protein